MTKIIKLKNKKKLVSYFTIFVLFLIFSFNIFTIRASAASDYKVGLIDTITDMADNTFGNGFVDDVIDSLKIDAAMWTGVSSVHTALLGVGTALLMLYFLINLMEDSTKDNFNFEHFLKAFIKLIIGYLFLKNSLVFAKGLFDFSTGILYSVQTSAFASGGSIGQWSKDTFRTGTENEWNSLGSIKTALSFIGAYLSLMIPNLLGLGLTLVIKITCYARGLEIVARALFIPIACPDVFTEGTRGAGWRYLKKFLAVCLQGAVIIGITMAIPILQIGLDVSYPATVSEVSAKIGESFWTLIAVRFAAVTLILKAQTIANDILGV